MNPIGVGVIGLGNFARRQHLPNLFRMPEARIRAVCDKDPELTEKMRLKFRADKGYTDHRKLLEDPDVEAVVIAVRDDVQASLAVSALRAGKHVYVEKPLADTEERFAEVREAVLETGLRLAVGFNKRFAPIYRRAREIARADGGPRNMHLRMADDSWRWAVGYPPGFMMKHDVCHFFDLLRWFTGAEIASVYAVRSRPDDDAVILRMSDDTVATILASGHGTMDMLKERVDIITRRGGLSAEDFVELRTYGFPSVEPVFTFPGHSDPDGEFMHKYLMEKLGSSGWSAIRRMTWELCRRAEAEVENPNVPLPPDAAEVRRFVARTIPNFLRDQGWMASLRIFLGNLSKGSSGGQTGFADHAGVEDARKAALAVEAAIRSLETGEVVRL